MYGGNTHVDITEELKRLLSGELLRDDPVLMCEDIKELLEGEMEAPRQTVVGYPARPLHHDLGHMFQLWADTKSCPLLELPTFELLDEKTYGETRSDYIANVTPKLVAYVNLWDHFSDDEKVYRLREVLGILGRRGLLDLLGMRKTVSSCDIWPVARTLLEETFQAKHSDSSELTVGARALAKHCHRDESSSWWGISTGKEVQKNTHASNILKRILDNAHWINIHQMVHDVKVIEVRQDQGYGARWTADGLYFRGFLEPQMVDGHQVGWRH